MKIIILISTFLKKLEKREIQTECKHFRDSISNTLTNRSNPPHTN